METQMAASFEVLSISSGFNHSIFGYNLSGIIFIRNKLFKFTTTVKLGGKKPLPITFQQVVEDNLSDIVARYKRISKPESNMKVLTGLGDYLIPYMEQELVIPLLSAV